MNSIINIDTARQRYLNLLHRCAQGRMDPSDFRARFKSCWADERDVLWASAWKAARDRRCIEQELRMKGQSPIVDPLDPRRFPRMLDRTCDLCINERCDETFHASIRGVLAAYRDVKVDSPEAKYINCPPHIHVFERPLPPNSRHRYPCTVEDIRAQLARVPEYDVEGIFGIGLAPINSSDRHAYGIYYRRLYPVGKPVILLHSTVGTTDFKLRRRLDPGTIERRLVVERSFGMETDQVGSSTFFRWSVEDSRRFIVEHVLLHEIGHHVQYGLRWRSGHQRQLPRRVKEQFAEDYAIRFNRNRRE